MIICPNCKKELQDETKFCDDCGSPVEVQQVVEAAEQSAPEQVAEVVEQSAPEQVAVSNEAEAVATEEAVAEDGAVAIEEVAEEKPRASLWKKLLIIGGVAVAVVAVALVLLSIFLPKKPANYILYLKDGELNYSGVSKVAPYEVTSDLEDSGLGAYDLYDSVKFTRDGKKLFYPDKVSEDDGTYTLYCRSAKNEKAEAVKIASDVYEYEINEDGTLVTYLNGDGDLYQHNLKDKEKIDSDVQAFYTSDDGKKVIYKDSEGKLYSKVAKKDKEKIDNDVTYLSYISEDYKTIYYMKEDSLYKKVEGKDKEKISGDVANINNVLDSGEAYYFKTEEKEIKVADYIVDDMKEADAAMTEPVYPDYPDYSDYGYYNYDAYLAAYERYSDEVSKYYDAIYDWNDKETRDSIRSNIADTTATMQTYALCYYDGKKEHVIAHDVNGSGICSYEKPVLVFYVYDLENAEKIKLSDLSYYSDVSEDVINKLSGSTKTKVALKDKISDFEHKDARFVSFSTDGNKLYFLKDYDEEKSNGDLYEMNVSGNSLGKAELYDSNVYWGYSGVSCTSDGNVIYLKNVEDYRGDLFVNKKEVDSDVSVYSPTYSKYSHTLIYGVDEDDESGAYTLKAYKGGKSTKISDDVYDNTFTPQGEILYIYDYSEKSENGELHLYKNGKSQKVDDDVEGIVRIWNRFEE